MNKVQTPHRILLAAWILASVQVLVAQNVEGPVQPLMPSTLRLANTSLYVYASGGSIEQANFWRANTDVLDKDSKLYSTYVDVGLGAEWYKHQLFVFWAGLGYMGERFATNRILSNNTGVYASWLTADFKFSCTLFLVGCHSEILLHTNLRNHDHLTYEGIYRECFNPVTLCFYGGIQMKLHKFILEARAGAYPIPQINVNKMAYYNMTTNHFDASYLLFRLSYRIFSTKNPIANHPFY